MQRTVSLRGIPEHDTTERRIFAAGLEGDVGERRSVDVAGATRGFRGKGADVDLDVLVWGDGLSPGVPQAEVPGVGVVVVGQTTVVVVELDVDGVERDGVQDAETCTTSENRPLARKIQRHLRGHVSVGVRALRGTRDVVLLARALSKSLDTVDERVEVRGTTTLDINVDTEATYQLVQLE